MALSEKEDFQRKLIQWKVDKVRDLEAQVSRLRILARNSTDPAMTAILRQQIDGLQAQQEPLCKTILEETKTLYKLRADPSSMEIPYGPWKGVKAEWNPTFVREIDQQRPIPDIQDHKIIQPGAPPDNQDGSPSLSAITWGDGKIELNASAFIVSPGYLASIIFHETHHLKQITKKSDELLSKYDREEQAYKAELAPGSGWSFDLNEAERAKIRSAMGTRLQNINNEPGGHDPMYRSAPGSPEPIRKGGEDSFAGGVGKLEPVTRQIKDWTEKKAKERREADERRNDQDVNARFRREAYRCGYEPIIQNSSYVGFRSIDPDEGFRYEFTAEMLPHIDLDVGRAQMMIARACADAELDYFGVGTPCNDSEVVIDTRWKERSFRDTLGLSSSAGQERCLDMMKERLKAPVSPGALNEVLKRYLKAEDERAKKERKQRERDRRRDERNQPPQPAQPKQSKEKQPSGPYLGPCGNLGSKC